MAKKDDKMIIIPLTIVVAVAVIGLYLVFASPSSVVTGKAIGEGGMRCFFVRNGEQCARYQFPLSEDIVPYQGADFRVDCGGVGFDIPLCGGQ